MRNREIQGVRGITAIIVFVSHVILNEGIVEKMSHTPLGVFYSGSAAVMMFFFLSGYFAYKVPFSWEKTKSSMWNKIKRLYPPYIISLLFGLLGFMIIGYSESFNNYFGITLAQSWSQSFSLRDFIIQCFMVLKHTDAGNLNPPVWTMIIEMRMVFLLPFFYLPLYYVSVFKKKPCVISYVLLVILVCYVMNSHVGISLFHWVPVFIMGGVLHHAIELGWLSGIKKCNNFTLYLAAAAGICLIALGRNYIIEGLNEDIEFPLSSIGCLIICGMIILKPEAFSALGTRAMVFMGDISYYFYLVHWIVLAMLRGVVVYMVETMQISYIVSYMVFVILGFTLSVLISAGMKNLSEGLRKS